MGRPLGYLIAVAILAASAGLAVYLVSLAPEPERQAPPPQVPYVQTGQAVSATGAVPIQGAGTVRPSTEIDIAPLVGGRVARLSPALQRGGRIKAGQPVLRIDPVDYKNRVREAEADLEARTADILALPEEAEFARQESEQFSRLQGSTGSVTDLLGPLALREPQLKASEAELLAPFDGYVLSESVDKGQFVNAGQAVGRLYAADAVEVVVPLTDADAALIPGLWHFGLVIRNDAWARGFSQSTGIRALPGAATWTGPRHRSINRLGTTNAIVRVPDPFSAGTLVSGSRRREDPPLLVGRFVDVESRGPHHQPTYFQLPRAALRPDHEVWTVHDNKVSIVKVQILQRSNDEVLVVEELEDGQVVITGGIQFATEGMVVQTGPGLPG